MIKNNIEVVYVNSQEQIIIPVEVDQPCTVEQAIHLSGILSRYLEIDLLKNKVGIFSKTVLLSHTLKDGDRIEIYRALLIDPKNARINRAKTKLKK